MNTLMGIVIKVSFILSISALPSACNFPHPQLPKYTERFQLPAIQYNYIHAN